MIVDLLWTALVEGAIVVGVALVALLRTLHWTYAQRRQLPRQQQVQQNLSRVLSGESIPAALESLPREAQCELLMRLANSLGGEARQQLAEQARLAGHLAREGRDLRSRHWWVRLRAVRLFSALGVVPENLQTLLRDPEPLVRAEAILLVATEPTPERVHDVVAELFGPASLARYASQMVLPRLGLAATHSLTVVLDNPPASPVVALRTAAAVASAELLPAALRWSAAPEAEVRAAAVELLGAIGGSQSCSRLVELLDDPVQADAARALGRLSHWQAGPKLAQLVCHPDWQVRYRAAQALHRCGPPGQLFLRQAGQSTNTEAAAMVRYVMALA